MKTLWHSFKILKLTIQQEKVCLTPSVLSEKLTLQQMSMMLFFSLSDDLAQIQALEQIFYMHIHKIFMDYNEDLL